MCILTLLISVFTIVEWNCENLFDCQHDTLRQDTEFTPEGNRRWTKDKYWKKVNNIAKTLMSCADDCRLPDLIALCEVENDSVMYDLTRRSPLRGGSYEYVMTHSRDPRGINVALAWCRPSFRPLETRSIRPEGDFGEHPPRDILYVKGLMIGGDTLHVMVAHAPSRLGGKKASEPRRTVVTEAITHVLDSIYHSSVDANIVVMGDFNATENEKSLSTIERHGMVNVSCGTKGNNGAHGSYKYQGVWEHIDHILVSPSLHARRCECKLHDAPWLLEDDTKFGGKKPRRSYNGWKFNPDGFSDHLPLVLTLKSRSEDKRQSVIFSLHNKNNIPFFLQEWKNSINFANNLIYIL
ncbi:MAG: endonuclease/exonuclease/phosphatase family protein [Prevotella sp.]